MKAAIAIIGTVAIMLSACTTSKIPRETLEDTLIVKQGEAFIPVPQAAFHHSSIVHDKDENNLWTAASLAAQNQNWKLCYEQAKKILEHRPFDEDALSYLAVASMNMQQFQRSVYFADLILQNNNKHSTALNIKGLVLLRSAKSLYEYKEAITYFDHAFYQALYEIAAGLNLGYLYLEMGEPIKAEDVFVKVKDRCPNCLTASLGLGIALNRRGLKDEAQEIFHNILITQPEHPIALYQLALQSLQEGDHMMAKSLLNRIDSSTDQYPKELQAKVAQLIKHL